MKIYMATWPAEISQARALEQAKIKDRLLSYYFICTEKDPDHWMQEYGKHGIVNEQPNGSRLRR